MGLHLSHRSLLLLAGLIAIFSPSTILDPPTQSALAHGAELTFWSVGQGDFITLATDRQCWAFDVGGNRPLSLLSLKRLKNQCELKPFRVFISHFDKDHIFNFERLIRFLRISDVYFSHLDPASRFGQKLLKQLHFQQIPVHEIHAGFKINSTKNGEPSLKCYWPPAGFTGRIENDRSLVFVLHLAGLSVLFTGDLPSRMEKNISLPQVDILKVGHHGSRSSTSMTFLKMLNPRICVVSVGAHNSYGHPTLEALSRMKNIGCTILRTDRLGTITLKM